MSLQQSIGIKGEFESRIVTAIEKAFTNITLTPSTKEKPVSENTNASEVFYDIKQFDVKFSHDLYRKTHWLDESSKHVDQLVDKLKENKQVVHYGFIRGYTDKSGYHNKNRDLSDKRILAVFDALCEVSIPAKRTNAVNFYALAYGEEKARAKHNVNEKISPVTLFIGPSPTADGPQPSGRSRIRIVSVATTPDDDESAGRLPIAQRGLADKATSYECGSELLATKLEE